MCFTAAVETQQVKQHPLNSVESYLCKIRKYGANLYSLYINPVCVSNMKHCILTFKYKKLIVFFLP